MTRHIPIYALVLALSAVMLLLATGCGKGGGY
jgi:hypothetical protein